MVTDPDHRHMRLRHLALYAQRIGKVFAAPATWARLVRERGWLRPRRRLYPAQPRQGIRASKPNEYWHIDVTIIKLLDGTRTYLHGVIDKFSRRILAWKLALRLEPQTTCQVLMEAAKNLPTGSDAATVVADSGVENVNRAVDDLLGLGQLRRVLAQVEVSFSNSMIGAWSLLTQARLALPAPARYFRSSGKTGRILRRAAQHHPSARRLRGPDAGRNVLWARGRSPQQPWTRPRSRRSINDEPSEAGQLRTRTFQTFACASATRANSQRIRR
jgi:hypothetical protein